MLRLALAFGALVLAVTLLSPTIASVHEAVEDLEFRREMPWSIWKWDTEVDGTPAPAPGACGREPIPTESEVTDWPERIRKDEPYEIGGHVIVPEEDGRGLPGVRVEVFLNETKELPGEYLGAATTDAEGRFRINGTFPFDLQATRYHLVAHAFQAQQGCMRYEEHWSDPEMDVVSDTNLTLEGPDRVVLGESLNLTGLLLDSVGAPVRDQIVTLRIGDERVEVQTDADGRFWWNATAKRPGDVTIAATYEGNKYYESSADDHKLRIAGEAVEIGGMDGEVLPVQRSTPHELTGRILLPPDQPVGKAELVFHGLEVVACEGCEPSDTVPLTPQPSGAFTTTFTVPKDVDVGNYTFEVRGESLDEKHPFNLTLRAPVYIELEADSPGVSEERIDGQARLYDDRDEPVRNGTVALLGPTGWETLSLDERGITAFSQAAPCGEQTARVIFNGTEEHAPAQAMRNVVVCPLENSLSPFGLPWWAWVLGVVAIVGGVWYARTWWRDRAPIISAGPPLALTFAAPDDDAPDLVGVGEAVQVTATLDEPLPEGHTLRLGAANDLDRVEPVGLSASRTVVPTRLGKLAVRGEILNAKGRVVTRRTVFVRVVRYAEEIEQRWRALKREGLGDLSDSISPREFERWLRDHADDLDPEVARRLVAIFEEADYGPRDVTRRELLGFLTAERRLQGVRRPAPR